MIKQEQVKIEIIKDDSFSVFYSNRFNFVINFYRKKLPIEIVKEFLYYANKPNNTAMLDFWSADKLNNLMDNNQYYFCIMYNRFYKKNTGFFILKKYLHSNGIKCEASVFRSVGCDSFKNNIIWGYFCRYYLAKFGIDFIEVYTDEKNKFMQKVLITCGMYFVHDDRSEPRISKRFRYDSIDIL